MGLKLAYMPTQTQIMVRLIHGHYMDVSITVGNINIPIKCYNDSDMLVNLLID